MNADRNKQLSIWQAILLVALSPLILPVAIFICLFVLSRYLIFLTGRWCFLAAWWVRWLPKGVDGFLVYNDSPYWQAYFEEQFIPRFGKRFLVLNWSKRRHWPMFSWRVFAFQFIAGATLYCPFVACFRRFKAPQCFRYYEPIKDLKHGKTKAIRQLEMELSAVLGEPIPPLMIDSSLLHGPGP